MTAPTHTLAKKTVVPLSKKLSSEKPPVFKLHSIVPRIVMPKITNQQIADLRKVLRPLVCRDGQMRLAGPCNPRRESFRYTPAPRQFVKVGDEVATLTTYHQMMGHPQFFRPTEAEVLAQLLGLFKNARWPSCGLLMRARYYVIDRSESAINEDRNVDAQGYQIATTRFFASRDKSHARHYSAYLNDCLVNWKCRQFPHAPME